MPGHQQSRIQCLIMLCVASKLLIRLSGQTSTPYGNLLGHSYQASLLARMDRQSTSPPSLVFHHSVCPIELKRQKTLAKKCSRSLKKPLPTWSRPHMAQCEQIRSAAMRPLSCRRSPCPDRTSPRLQLDGTYYPTGGALPSG